MTQESFKISDRPSWNEYFLMLAFDVAWRSDDLFIKHGAVIVDNLSKHIISTGYNNTFKGCDTNIVKIHERETRRPWMIHAEENAIMNSTKNAQELKDGATIYVTGLPCVNCLQRIINFGITHLVYAERTGSITEDNSSHDMRNKILNMTHLKIDTINTDNKWIKKNNFSPSS